MIGLMLLRDKFNESIQVRLTCYFILILLPLILFSLFANVRSQHILEQELGDRTLSAMNSTLEYVDLTLDSLKSLSTMISTDVNLTSRLKHEEDTLTPTAVIDFTHVLSHISNITAVNPFLSEVTIFHGNSKMMISSKVGALHREQARTEPWYADVVQANGANILYLPDRQEEALSGWSDPVYNTDQIIFMRLMDLYSRDRGNNVLMLSVPKSRLLDYLVNLVPSRNSHVYLFDEARRLIVTNAPSDERLAAEDIPSKTVSVQAAPHSSGKNMMVRVESARSGWSLLMVQPESEIYKKSKPLQQFSYVIILISCVLALGISWFVYSGIAAPISSLAAGMRKLRMGNLHTRLDHSRRDELGYLTDAFNQTVEQQRHLIRDIYEQQLRLTKTELKFLQSQINPHFLYNTLDSIYWSAKEHGAQGLSEMVLNLSRFFRLSLSKGRDAFTIEETFEHLQYYLRIQQRRFRDQFIVEFRSSDESKRLYVLKLLLQPLVENAILHGLEKKKAGGKLVVSAEVREDRLVLQVIDHGRGIKAEELIRIHHALNQAGHQTAHPAAEPTGSNFGLLNVKSRIKIYYGETAEFTLESKEGEGTTATIDLPAALCAKPGEGDETHELDDRRR